MLKKISNKINNKLFGLACDFSGIPRNYKLSKEEKHIQNECILKQIKEMEGKTFIKN